MCRPVWDLVLLQLLLDVFACLFLFLRCLFLLIGNTVTTTTPHRTEVRYHNEENAPVVPPNKKFLFSKMKAASLDFRHYSNKPSTSLRVCPRLVNPGISTRAHCQVVWELARRHRSVKRGHYIQCIDAFMTSRAAIFACRAVVWKPGSLSSCSVTCASFRVSLLWDIVLVWCHHSCVLLPGQLIENCQEIRQFEHMTRTFIDT